MQRSKSMPKLSSASNSAQQKQDTKKQTLKKPIRYRHGYTPIKPKRYLMPNCTHCFTVVSNVECQIEKIEPSKSLNDTMSLIVTEICRFKFDEDKIWVCKFNKQERMTFNIDEMPQCPLYASCYLYDLLPAKLWLKYSRACKLMNIVRSKNPIITVYKDAAKGVLFDSTGLFEVKFFADSTKIIYSGDVIRIVRATGIYIVFLEDNSFY